MPSMAGCGEGLKVVCQDIPLPRQCILINIRLGILYWVLMAGALALSIWEITQTTDKTYKLTAIDVQLESADGDYSNKQVPHCLQPNSYWYTWSSKLAYKPTSCKRLQEGEDIIGDPSSMFFMTAVKDSTTTTSSGSDCAALQTACTGSSGLYSQTVVNGPCKCEHPEEFMVQGQENTNLYLAHSYKLTVGPSEFYTARSNEDYFTRKMGSETTQIKKKIQTTFVDRNGKACNIGGRSDWLPEHGDIGGPLKDYLACAGLTLDDTSSDTVVDKHQPGLPSLRLSGVKLQLTLKFSNLKSDSRVNDNVQAFVDVMIEAAPSLDTRVVADAVLPSGGRSRHRYRQANGVFVSFVASGAFAYPDALTAITSLRNIVVILGLPLVIVRMLTLYGLGLISEIYRQVLRPHFNIVEQFHGLAARMMVSGIGYRFLTMQMETHVNDIKPMNKIDVELLMEDAFHHDMQGDAKSGKVAALEKDEVTKLAHVVVAGLDTDGEGKVSFDEFVHACSCNEPMDTRTMISFFDDERRRHVVERTLDPTYGQIKDIVKKLPPEIREGTHHAKGMRQSHSGADNAKVSPQASPQTSLKATAEAAPTQPAAGLAAQEDAQVIGLGRIGNEAVEAALREPPPPRSEP